MKDEMEDPMEDSAAIGWTEADLDLATLGGEHLPAGHRSGFVAVVGRTNVGKSTLMNAYLGQKVAIVSPKPQTTRSRQFGILTLPDFQIIFVDTPGWHTPQHRLGEYMVGTAARAIPDADIVLFVVDVSQPPAGEDRLLAELVEERRGQAPVVLALNKVDLLSPDDLQARRDVFRALLPSADWTFLSATRGDHRDELLEMMAGALPEGPRYFPADQVTDVRVRDLAGELVREQALKLLHHEVPHAIAVVVDEYKERSANLTYIQATLFVEKDSQKGILIGKGGRMLKRIGAAARTEIESVLGVRVYLELWVKVRPKWRKKREVLRQLGYVLPKE